MQKTINTQGNLKINYSIKKVSPNFIVFLHGLGGDLAVWDPFAAGLNKQGFSTIAVDIRGHGLSGRPTLKSDYSPASCAEDIHKVIVKEKVKDFIIIGHSYGGIVAANFYAKYPSLARAYIFIATRFRSPRILSMLGPAYFLINRILSKKNPSPIAGHRNFDTFLGTWDYDLKRIYDDMKHASMCSWMYTFENLSGLDVTQTVCQIKKPVLVILGGKDTIASVKATKVKSENAKLEIIRDANHMVVVNNKEELAKKILAFVDLVYLRKSKSPITLKKGGN